MKKYLIFGIVFLLLSAFAMADGFIDTFDGNSLDSRWIPIIYSLGRIDVQDGMVNLTTTNNLDSGARVMLNNSYYNMTNFIGTLYINVPYAEASADSNGVYIALKSSFDNLKAPDSYVFRCERSKTLTNQNISVVFYNDGNVTSYVNGAYYSSYRPEGIPIYLAFYVRGASGTKNTMKVTYVEAVESVTTTTTITPITTTTLHSEQASSLPDPFLRLSNNLLVIIGIFIIFAITGVVAFYTNGNTFAVMIASISSSAVMSGIGLISVYIFILFLILTLAGGILALFVLGGNKP